MSDITNSNIASHNTILDINRTPKIIYETLNH